MTPVDVACIGEDPYLPHGRTFSFSLIIFFYALLILLIPDLLNAMKLLGEK